METGDGIKINGDPISSGRLRFSNKQATYYKSSYQKVIKDVLQFDTYRPIES